MNLNDYFFQRAQKQALEIEDLTKNYSKQSTAFNLLPLLRFISENLHGIHRWKKVQAKNLPRELVAPLAYSLAKAQFWAYLKGRLHILDEIRESQLKFAEVTAEPVLPQEAIRFFESKIPMTRAEFDVLSEVFKARAFTVAYVTELDLIAAVKDELKKALEQGLTLREFRANLNELFARRGYTPLNPYHIETVFRTNLFQAYNAGRFEQSLRAPGVYLLEYMAILDDRTTPICRRLHGIRKPTGDPFWQTYYPPNHLNCRSVVRPITTAEARLRGIRMTRRIPDVMPDEGFRSNPLLSRLPQQYIRRARSYGIDTEALENSLNELMQLYEVEKIASDMLSKTHFPSNALRNEFLQRVFPQFKKVMRDDEALRSAFGNVVSAVSGVNLVDSAEEWLGQYLTPASIIELNMAYPQTAWNVLYHELTHTLLRQKGLVSPGYVAPEILSIFRKEAKRLADALSAARNLPDNAYVLIEMLRVGMGVGEAWGELQSLMESVGVNGFLRGYAFKNPEEFIATAIEAISRGDVIVGETTPDLEHLLTDVKHLILEMPQS